jgi:uncharacterized membrane protein YfcA
MDDSLLKLLLLFAVGNIAGIINVNAGGGSSLTLPALIFLGLNPTVANGTNRIGILIQNLSAIVSFRHQKYHQFKTSLILALFTLPGAVLGAMLSVRLSDEWFQRILGIIMIGVVGSMIFNRRKPSGGTVQSMENTEKKNWLIYPAMLGIGFYGGFIQMGVGFILMAALYHILSLALVKVNMHKVFIVFIYTLPALLVFGLSGKVNWGYGLVLAAGTSFGAWWGARIAVKGGDRIIRLLLGLAIFIMALKLLRLF